MERIDSHVEARRPSGGGARTDSAWPGTDGQYAVRLVELPGRGQRRMVVRSRSVATRRLAPPVREPREEHELVAIPAPRSSGRRFAHCPRLGPIAPFGTCAGEARRPHAGGSAPGSIWLSSYTRPLLFLAVGAVCFAVQLVALVALLGLSLDANAANATSFLAAAEVKFVLSWRLVWRDRPIADEVWGRFARFNVTTGVVFVVDQAVFAATNPVLTAVPAAILAVAASTAASYVICDGFVFRSSVPKAVVSGDVIAAPGAYASALITPPAAPVEQVGASAGAARPTSGSVADLNRRHRGPLPKPTADFVPVPSAIDHDWVAWTVAVVAATLSVGAFTVTAHLGAVLLYTDSISHLEIARRVLDGTSPGLAQLGGVWLPLPHLLMLPFVWDNALYSDGLAGSIPSMAAFVITVVLIYRIVYRLTGQKLAGVAGTSVFALNANMLYLQSTPMTEALLFCLLAAMVYCLQQWATTDRYQYLVAGGMAALLATLTRYESWAIVACLMVSSVVIAWQRNRGDLTPRLHRVAVLDRAIAFFVVAFAGIAGWLIWNGAIVGNPLNFQNGQFAKPSLWVSHGEPAIGNWLVSAKTYAYAMLDTITWPVLVLAGIGLVSLLALEFRCLRTAARSLPVLSLLVMVPFFVVSLYTGQRPLYVKQVPPHGLYNVRFALVMLLPVSIFIGYLAGRVPFRWGKFLASGLVLAVILVQGISLIRDHDVVTYNEPQVFVRETRSIEENDVIAYLHRRYTGGRVLMESFGNELVAFHLPVDQLVYEGSYRQWLPALRDPSSQHIRWIIGYYGGGQDEVAGDENASRLAPYQEVYQTPDHSYRIYQLRT
jgi:putative flippase GtrA